MTAKDKKALDEYLTTKLGTTIAATEEKQRKKERLKKSLSEDLTCAGVFCRWLKEACKHRDGDELDDVMLLGWIFELFDTESVKILEEISLENWVKSNNLEDMVELIENYGSKDKVNILASMALQKYPDHYLGEQDEHITRKAMWSLHRLYKQQENKEAIATIKELSHCGDSMVEDFAKHHLEKLSIT